MIFQVLCQEQWQIPDPPYKICLITQDSSSVKPMSDIKNTRQKWPQTNIYNKKNHINFYHFVLYSDLVVLTPPQNMFNMLPHN